MLSPGSAIAPPWGAGCNPSGGLTLKGLHNADRRNDLSDPFRVNEKRMALSICALAHAGGLALPCPQDRDAATQ